MKATFRNTCTILLVLLFAYSNIQTQVRLPKLISDHMVLQRDVGTNIWGWASPGEKVSVKIFNKEFSANTLQDGKWMITLPPHNAGGPFDMTISGSNKLIVKDIVFGDVWLCSGQSNMELSVRRVSPIYGPEIAGSENRSIRHFTVPQIYDFNLPHDDMKGGTWKTADPKNVMDFSAAAYFFARELNDKYKIPIGIINASLGGSPAEAWMSEEALKQFPHYLVEAQKYKDSSLIKSIEDADAKRFKEWYALLWQRDNGFKDLINPWYKPNLNTTDWQNMNIPSYWADNGLKPINGVIWFRKKIDLPEKMMLNPATLILGRIVDADSVWVNGCFIGTVSYQYPPRRYSIPPNVLKAGKNTIVVRVISNIGMGGFVPDKLYAIIAGRDTLNIAGEWQYKIGAEMEPLAGQTFIRWKPAGLYNGMIAPLLNYKIKGAAWYQGEANTFHALEYRELLPAMIRNWREDFNQGDFPFLYVQLPNFMETTNSPSRSSWAMLRDSQRRTLAVKNTAMAVAIDLGEWNDIHPLNKKDVGKRLALAAAKLAYGQKKIVSVGPLFKEMKVIGNKAILSFTNSGSGLIAKGGGELKYFTIAGPDSQFVWANAKIEKDKVIVWNDSISIPAAVRYAWANNPEGANLYNKEGLPASPFRTDEFPE